MRRRRKAIESKNAAETTMRKRGNDGRPKTELRK
jgi:hypothetical protein